MTIRWQDLPEYEPPPLPNAQRGQRAFVATNVLMVCAVVVLAFSYSDNRSGGVAAVVATAWILLMACGAWMSDLLTRSIHLLGGRNPTRSRAVRAWAYAPTWVLLMEVTILRLEPTEVVDVRPGVAALGFWVASWRPFALVRRITTTLTRADHDTTILTFGVLHVTVWSIAWWSLRSSDAFDLSGLTRAAALASMGAAVASVWVTKATNQALAYRILARQTYEEHRYIRSLGLNPYAAGTFLDLVMAKQERARRRGDSKALDAAREAAAVPALGRDTALVGTATSALRGASSVTSERVRRLGSSISHRRRLLRSSSLGTSDDVSPSNEAKREPTSTRSDDASSDGVTATASSAVADAHSREPDDVIEPEPAPSDVEDEAGSQQHESEISEPGQPATEGRDDLDRAEADVIGQDELESAAPATPVEHTDTEIEITEPDAEAVPEPEPPPVPDAESEAEPESEPAAHDVGGGAVDEPSLPSDENVSADIDELEHGPSSAHGPPPRAATLEMLRYAATGSLVLVAMAGAWSTIGAVSLSEPVTLGRLADVDVDRLENARLMTTAALAAAVPLQAWWIVMGFTWLRRAGRATSRARALRAAIASTVCAAGFALAFTLDAARLLQVSLLTLSGVGAWAGVLAAAPLADWLRAAPIRLHLWATGVLLATIVHGFSNGTTPVTATSSVQSIAFLSVVSSLIVANTAIVGGVFMLDFEDDIRSSTTVARWQRSRREARNAVN